MKKIIVKNPDNLPVIDHSELTMLQGDLKTLSEKNMEKLCRSIQKHGYFVPAFVWTSGEKHYILDATQRFHALQKMAEEGYEIPPIPYVSIEAADKKDAAEKLLQITSRYGEINPNTSFLSDLELEIDEIEIAIPELNISVIKDFDANKEWTDMPEFEQEDKSGYQQLIINFLDGEAVNEFSELIGQKITEKTKSIWYPKQEKEENIGLVWKNEP